MRLVKAKNAKQAQRKQSEEAQLLGMVAASDTEVLEHNNTIHYSIENGGHTLAQVEHLRNSLFCSQCMHTRFAHIELQVDPHAIHAHYQCSTCGCSRSPDFILKWSLQKYNEKKRTEKAAAPRAPKSQHHDKNKRVLQAERRNPSSNAGQLYVCLNCNHEARFHNAVYVKGALVGNRCTRQLNGAQCPCNLAWKDVEAAGKADAES